LENLIERYDGWKYTLKEYFPVIMIFSFLITFGIYESIKIGNPEELFLSHEFDEELIDVYQTKSFLYIQLSNKSKRIEIRESCNYEYMELSPCLNEFLKEGDRLIKNKCSDTLYVIRDEKKYHFLIEDILYNSTRRNKAFIEKYNSRREIINRKNDCK